jgi:K+-transporting ATPase ATPase A chain
VIIPLLAAAGDPWRAKASRFPSPPAPSPTRGPLFVTLLVGVVVIVGALTFFPALRPGPIVEHLLQ